MRGNMNMDVAPYRKDVFHVYAGAQERLYIFHTLAHIMHIPTNSHLVV